MITRDPVGNIDGVESDGKGGYIVTDWMAGKVLRISPQGDVRLIRQFAQGTADHAFLPAVNVLIVPHMNENKVAATISLTLSGNPIFNVRKHRQC